MRITNIFSGLMIPLLWLMNAHAADLTAPNQHGVKQVQSSALFTSRNIVAGERIREGDIIDANGEVSQSLDILGLEARRNLYQGQAVTFANFREPIMVKRNAIVRMQYATGALKITTEGRALDQGSTGDLVRVMNLGSRQTVTAQIIGADMVKVGQ